MPDSGKERLFKEGLFKRWSRLKRQSAAENEADRVMPARSARDPGRPGHAGELTASDAKTSVAADATGDTSGARRSAEPLPDLPSIEELGPESDFSAFMDPRVDDDLRRTALKALFRNPEFNITDGLDVYAEDYTKLEKLTPAMVAALRYAQRTLFGEDDKREVEHVRTDAVQSADELDSTSGKAVAAETHGGSQSSQLHADLQSNNPEKAESNVSAVQLEQPLSESPPPRSNES